MEFLRELVFVVNRNKVKQIELLDLEQKPASKINQFYQAISTEKIKTDEEAKAYLYNKGVTPNAYYNLKARLLKKLLNTIFFIDNNGPKQTDRRIAMHEASKSLAAAQLLMSKGAPIAAVKQFTKLLRVAEKYEFNSIALTAVRALRIHYGARKIDQKKYLLYSKLCDTYQEIDYWENKAVAHYTRIVSGYNDRKQDRKKLQVLCRGFYEELRAKEKSIQSYSFIFYTALIRLMQYTIVDDYISVIPISEELLDVFQNKPFSTSTAIQNFLHHQIVGHLQAGDFEKGLEAGKKSQGLSPEGTSNWFKHQEFHLLLGMQTGRYQEALDVYQTTTNHSQFSLLKEKERENWTLFHAYLTFLQQHGKIVVDESAGKFPAFRMQSFLNKMPTYTQDKEGKNVAVLIINILYLISRRKKNEAIDRIERMEKYCLRYLNKEDNRRAYYFLRLLLSIPSGSFQIDRIEILAEASLQELAKLPSTSSNLFGRMEIIPYEVLWEMIINDLRT
ncbi:hypothetical protein CEQ90_02565 [Lewinellaceae bacterium SD302]|nr:hypothetical protein CEQ90_02565 [Lewinellaceae bacterium SD302]